MRLALSLASQAAVAYENRKLYNEIETLFEGLVSAAVTAIEQRDPRPPDTRCAWRPTPRRFAETVDRTATGPYSRAHFDPEQMKEIRYAALLHDFGKVGVREDVLVKAKKLYPMQMDLLKQRFDYIRKEMEAGMVRRKLQMYLERDRGDALAEIARLSEDFDQRLTGLGILEFIVETNEPTLLEESEVPEVREIAQQYVHRYKGVERPYIKPMKCGCSPFPREAWMRRSGSRSNLTWFTRFNFLNQIPWTKELRRVPEIARAHHEKLNGKGYPYKLRGDEIPLPTKMMTICDIFDALTASDRPYKRAVPIDRALSILESSVHADEIDWRAFPDIQRFQDI